MTAASAFSARFASCRPALAVGVLAVLAVASAVFLVAGQPVTGHPAAEAPQLLAFLLVLA